MDIAKFSVKNSLLMNLISVFIIFSEYTRFSL